MPAPAGNVVRSSCRRRSLATPTEGWPSWPSGRYGRPTPRRADAWHCVIGGRGPRVKLELRGVTKLFGENGAGKSTLMNVLYGLYHQDDGEIVIDGAPQRFRSPRDAIAAGIGMVHQHFMLVPVFTVAENVMLGAERTRGRLFG